jgi:protein TonB
MLGSKLDILKQEWIDVVFTDRNKAYGAYDLRKKSGFNTTKALIIGVAAFVFAISLPTIINIIAGFIPKKENKVKIVPVVLQPPPPVNKQKPPPPPPEPPKPKIDQVKFPPPVVKPDNEVKEQPPTVKELEVADPGQKTQKGDPNADIVINTPVGNGDENKVTEDENKIFTAVEQEPTPAGGISKFYEYLSKNIRYPAVAKENNIQGKVFLTFVVEKDGSITDVKVLRGIGSGCDEEAVRVLRNAPRWKPGIQNGRPVRVQYQVPVSFALQQEDQ